VSVLLGVFLEQEVYFVESWEHLVKVLVDRRWVFKSIKDCVVVQAEVVKAEAHEIYFLFVK